MAIESIVSLTAAVFAGSFALAAFGGDSIVELISAAAVAGYLRRFGRGKGDDKILQRTEKITSLLLFSLIPIISLGALVSFFTGMRAEASILGIIIAVGAVLIMPVLWIGKLRIGRKTHCLPLTTDAAESATCLFMSLVLLAGLLTISFLGYWWVDYLTTGAILVFVAREAVESLERKDVPGAS
jgi:divalent metal cation (Fe/Co/Zn/Cd) transporter